MYHVQGNLHFEIKEEKFKHKLCPMEAFKSTFVSPSSFERDTENSKLWFVIRASGLTRKFLNGNNYICKLFLYNIAVDSSICKIHVCIWF